VFDVVVPTVGRPSLTRLLWALEPAVAHGLGRIVVADDRPTGEVAGPRAGDATDLFDPAVLPPAVAARIVVVRSGGRGPAAARNAGWRRTEAPWVVVLDDDVVPPSAWGPALVADLAAAAPDVAGVQARLTVPLPADRRPTDQERSDLALEDAAWATADMAFRRAALEAAGGFDERFPRAYREDADLALRLLRAGWRLTRGARVCVHPPRAAPWSASLRRQRGNADDPLMRALHGRDWRAAAGVPRGRRRVHVATVAAGVAALTLAAARRRRAAAAAAAWAGSTAQFTWIRVAPGPRTPREVATMAATSALIPPAAVLHWLRGRLRVVRMDGPAPQPTLGPEAVGVPSWPAQGAAEQAATDDPGVPAAILFDRDATLIVDVPYNGDPALVQPLPGAREALDRVRAAGIPIGVVSNQSGVARGLIAPEQVRAVNARVAELLGPFDDWQWCPHGPDDDCACRKPRPGMVLAAARALGVAPERCAVIGDIGADVEAAAAAGARGVLVPTPITRGDEVAAAREVAPTIGAAVDLLLARAGTTA
jgi:HAD superfamily hydrolase (TIGR01662 family)